MERYRKRFKCEVLTPDGPVCAVQAVSAVIPARDGQLGVLGGRAPLAAAVGAGPLTVELDDGSLRQYFVAGGFAYAREDVLTVLAEACQAVEAIDREAAWAEIQQAKALPKDTPEAVARREQAVTAARTRFRLVQQYRRRQRRQRRAEAVAGSD